MIMEMQMVEAQVQEAVKEVAGAQEIPTCVHVYYLALVLGKTKTQLADNVSALDFVIALMETTIITTAIQTTPTTTLT